MRTHLVSTLLPLCLIAGMLINQSNAAPPVDPQVRGFFQTYCIKCHGPKTQKADFRVDTMLKVSQSVEDAEYWQLVLDNLNLGEMPPEVEKQPPSAQVEKVTRWIEAELKRASKALAGESGEVVLRRLNRTEYEYTIQDLFEVHGDYAEAFPADASAEGFNTNGAALVLSAEQINQYLSAAEFVLNRAIMTKPRPKTNLVSLTLADFNRQIEARAKRQKGDQRKPHYYPKHGDDYLIPMQYTKPDTRNFFRVREPGWYRVQVTGYAARNPERRPLRLRVDYGSLRQGTVTTLAGVVQYTSTKPQTVEYQVYLQPNEVVRLVMLDGPKWMRGSDIAANQDPTVAIRKIEMEGPIFKQWPPKGHRMLLGTKEASLQDADIPKVLGELAPRLFRRPVKPEVVQDYVAFYQNYRPKMQPLDAFTMTVKAMMVSPQFLYHVEVGKQPDDYAIANRLSYFLWRSAPDEELYQLAASGMLAQPAELKRQASRMLADPKSERFLNDFVGQWLKIDLVGDMQPDKNLYPEYDPELERAMIEETRGFVQEMLNQDLNVRNLIDSDWAILNDRLAKHYGISGIEGNEFRQVALRKDETIRGGLLTQASILNITSNGTTTSPVVRGVWVLDRLLGTPAPPPPPDVPAIEPDIRGASTIQEQLAKHRSIKQCASCHRKIDPYGIALENFDVIGGWRTNYRALKTTKNRRRPQLVDGPKVIASDQLAQQGKFDDFREFRQLLLAQDQLLFKNMVRQLATYALGRRMGFADEELLQQIVDKTQSHGGGMKTMLLEFVASPLFQRP